MEYKLKPESRVILLGLLRREKQRLLGKAIDGVPASVEDQLIALDMIAQEILDSWVENKEVNND